MTTPLIWTDAIDLELGVASPERAQILEASKHRITQASNHCGVVWVLRQDQQPVTAAVG